MSDKKEPKPMLGVAPEARPLSQREYMQRSAHAQQAAMMDRDSGYVTISKSDYDRLKTENEQLKSREDKLRAVNVERMKLADYDRLKAENEGLLIAVQRGVIDAETARKLSVNARAARDYYDTAASTQPSRRPVAVGDIVFYVPPQDCTGKTTLEKYAAIVTQVNETWDPEPADRRDRGKVVETVELCTLGPNSMYFQHSVPFSETLAAGCWSFRE